MNIEDRLKVLASETATLLKMRDEGVTNLDTATTNAAKKLNDMVTETVALARITKVDFNLRLGGYQQLTYSADHDKFYDPDDGYGWSSSSLGC